MYPSSSAVSGSSVTSSIGNSICVKVTPPSDVTYKVEASCEAHVIQIDVYKRQVADPASGLYEHMDILVKDGKIVFDEKNDG